LCIGHRCMGTWYEANGRDFMFCVVLDGMQRKEFHLTD
jgi:hypothetical protein